MPRRHRSARDRAGPVTLRPPVGAAPPWAHAAGFSIRQVRGEKAYRCPGCQGVIRPDEPHLVVVPEADPESRRHWHMPCWRQERRRRG
jgi:hypothetical protein